MGSLLLDSFVKPVFFQEVLALRKRDRAPHGLWGRHAFWPSLRWMQFCFTDGLRRKVWKKLLKLISNSWSLTGMFMNKIIPIFGRKYPLLFPPRPICGPCDKDCVTQPPPTTLVSNDNSFVFLIYLFLWTPASWLWKSHCFTLCWGRCRNPSWSF